MAPHVSADGVKIPSAARLYSPRTSLTTTAHALYGPGRAPPNQMSFALVPAALMK